MDSLPGLACLAKLGDGRGENPTVMVGDKNNKTRQKKTYSVEIEAYLLGFSLDQYHIRLSSKQPIPYKYNLGALTKIIGHFPFL
jgi:hypothetical protein